MEKGNRIVISFIITSVVIFTSLLVFVLVSISIRVSANSIAGLCPSIGLGKSFSSNDLNSLTGLYSVYLEDSSGISHSFDETKRVILNNYTMVGAKYYENTYSSLMENNLLVMLPLIISFIFMLDSSVASLIISINKNNNNHMIVDKNLPLIMIGLSLLSLNFYALYRFIQKYIKS